MRNYTNLLSSENTIELYGVNLDTAAVASTNYSFPFIKLPRLHNTQFC